MPTAARHLRVWRVRCVARSSLGRAPQGLRRSPSWHGHAWRPRTASRKRSVSMPRSEEHTSELQSRENLVCRLLLEKKKLNRDRIASSALMYVKTVNFRFSTALFAECILNKEGTTYSFPPSGILYEPFFYLVNRHPPDSTLFPYTTLFR